MPWRAQTRLATLVGAVATVLTVGACSPGPAEVHTPAGREYPRPPTAAAGAVLPMTGAPLLVDGRLRVFAGRHEVRADGPIDVLPARKPYWSLRRNTVGLLAVVATGRSVVSLWLDGELIAIDAATGAVAWRARPAPSEGGYPGRRTGAHAVYPSDRLHTAVIDAGRPVVLRDVDGQLWAFDAVTGAQLWHKVFEGRLPNCRVPGFTTSSGLYATVDYCGNRGTVELYDVSTGALARTWEPPGGPSELGLFAAGCRVARSECGAVVIPTAGKMLAWTFGDDTPVVADGIGSLTARIAGTVAADASDPFGPQWVTEIVGRDLQTGRELWRWAAPAGGVQLVAAQPTAFHLITRDRDLVTIDATSGKARSRFSLLLDGDTPDWSIGYVYASDGFVAVERLTGIADPIVPDDDYYFTERPVLLAAT